MEGKGFETKSGREIYDNKDKTFKLETLPIYTEYQVVELSKNELDFFSNNDFLVLPNETLFNMDLPSPEGSILEWMSNIPHQAKLEKFFSRGLVGVKLGKLYIQYDTGGKGSYELSINFLDFKNKQVIPLMGALQHQRMGILPMSDLVPFSSLYSATIVAGQFEREKTHKTLVEKAHAVREILTKWALGREVKNEEYVKAYGDFLAEGYLEEKVEKQKEVKVPNKSAQHDPKDIKNIANQLFNTFVSELTVTKDDFIKILKDYQAKTKKSIDKDLIKNILSTYVDQDRYPVQSVLDEITPEVTESILIELNPAVYAPKEKESEKKESKKPQYPIDTGEQYGYTKNNVLGGFLQSKMSSPQEYERKQEEQQQIEKIKQGLRQDLKYSLSKSVNVAAESKLGQSIGKAFNLPVDNLKHMRTLESLVHQDQYYTSMQDFAKKVLPVMNLIKPFGTGDFHKKLDEYRKQIQSHKTEVEEYKQDRPSR